MPKYVALHSMVADRGTTLHGLATDLDVPVSQVAYWMAGWEPVPASLLSRVAAALDVDADQLL
jgi:hypothetical protein